MTTTKVTVNPTRVARMQSPQRNVGIIFLTLGLLLWVAIWAQTIQGTRQASILDMSFPVLLTALSFAFTVRAHGANVRTSRS